jgi:hypothetical protein
MEEECWELKKVPEGQYWCELSDHPCVRYTGDSLNGEVCEYYEEEKEEVDG